MNCGVGKKSESVTIEFDASVFFQGSMFRFRNFAHF